MASVRGGGAPARPGYWRRLGTSGATQFWTAFWIVIIGLAALYAYAQWTIAQKARVVIDETGQPKVSQEWAREWQEIVNELTATARLEIDSVSRERLKAQIDAKVDAAFAPVYGQIPKFAEFHYSVVGEYAELLAVLVGSGAASLQRILFDEVNLDARLDTATNEVGDAFQAILGEALTKVRSKLEGAPNLTADDLKLLSGALKLTEADVRARFSNELTALRAGGAGAAGVVVAGKAAAKKSAAVLAKKVGAKAAAKAAAKAITPGAAGAGGAAACSWLGPLGAGVCGVGAAVVAWFATDAVIIAIDELYNRDEFETEIRQLVDEQKRSIKDGLTQNYNQLLDAVSRDIDRKIQATTPAGAVGER
jgi:hypothetical protein